MSSGGKVNKNKKNKSDTERSMAIGGSTKVSQKSTSGNGKDKHVQQKIIKSDVNHNEKEKEVSRNIGKVPPKPTDEQLRIAQMTSSDKQSEKIMQDKIFQVIQVVSVSEDAAVVALHDCDNDVSAAISSLLEGGGQGEWKESTKKKKKPPVLKSKDDAESNKENRKDGKERGISRGRGGKFRGRGGSNRGNREDSMEGGGRGMGSNRRGRMSNGTSFSRGRGGGRGRGFARSFQKREEPDMSGFPETIDTWGPPEKPEVTEEMQIGEWQQVTEEKKTTTTTTMEHWGDDGSSATNDDWEAGEWTGKTAIFSPSTAVEQNYAPVEQNYASVEQNYASCEQSYVQRDDHNSSLSSNLDQDSGNMSAMSTLNTSSMQGNMSMASGSIAPMSMPAPNMTSSLQNSGNIPMQNSANIQMQSSANIQMQNSANIQMQSSGNIQMQSSGNIPMQNSCNISMQSSGNIPMQNSGNISMQNSGNIPIQNTGNISGMTGDSNVMSMNQNQQQLGGSVRSSQYPNVQVPSSLSQNQSIDFAALLQKAAPHSTLGGRLPPQMVDATNLNSVSMMTDPKTNLLADSLSVGMLPSSGQGMLPNSSQGMLPNSSQGMLPNSVSSLSNVSSAQSQIYAPQAGTLNNSMFPNSVSSLGGSLSSSNVLTSQNASLATRAKPQRSRLNPSTKIPSKAVEMPELGMASLNMQFAGLEFGTETFDLTSSDNKPMMPISSAAVSNVSVSADLSGLGSGMSQQTALGSQSISLPSSQALQQQTQNLMSGVQRSSVTSNVVSSQPKKEPPPAPGLGSLGAYPTSNVGSYGGKGSSFPAPPFAQNSTQNYPSNTGQVNSNYPSSANSAVNSNYPSSANSAVNSNYPSSANSAVNSNYPSSANSAVNSNYPNSNSANTAVNTNYPNSNSANSAVNSNYPSSNSVSAAVSSNYPSSNSANSAVSTNYPNPNIVASSVSSNYPKASPAVNSNYPNSNSSISVTSSSVVVSTVASYPAPGFSATSTPYQTNYVNASSHTLTALNPNAKPHKDTSQAYNETSTGNAGGSMNSNMNATTASSSSTNALSLGLGSPPASPIQPSNKPSASVVSGKGQATMKSLTSIPAGMQRLAGAQPQLGQHLGQIPHHLQAVQSQQAQQYLQSQYVPPQQATLPGIHPSFYNMQQQPLYSLEDLQIFSPQRIPHIPQAAATTMAGGREAVSIASPPYTDANKFRSDNSASPAPSTVSQGGAAVPSYITTPGANAGMPPYFMYQTMPAMHSNFSQYATPAIIQIPSNTHTGSTTTQFPGPPKIPYNAAGSYYDGLTHSQVGRQTQDYKSYGASNASKSSVNSTVSNANPASEMTSYNKNHLSKVGRTYEKGTYGTAPPGAYNLQASAGTNPMAPNYTPMYMMPGMPAGPHSTLMHHQLHQDGTNATNPRSAATAANKATSKGAYTGSYWGT